MKDSSSANLTYSLSKSKFSIIAIQSQIAIRDQCYYSRMTSLKIISFLKLRSRIYLKCDLLLSKHLSLAIKQEVFREFRTYLPIKFDIKIKQLDFFKLSSTKSDFLFPTSFLKRHVFLKLTFRFISYSIRIRKVYLKFRQRSQGLG